MALAKEEGKRVEPSPVCEAPDAGPGQEWPLPWACCCWGRAQSRRDSSGLSTKETLNPRLHER